MGAADLHVDRARDAVVVHPPTEVDVSNEALLDLLLDQACALAHRKVVVDLAAVTFVDHAAVGAMVEAAGRLQAQGRTLQVVNPCRPFLRIALALGHAALLAPDPWTRG